MPLTVSPTESLVVIPEPIEPHAAPYSNKSECNELNYVLNDSHKTPSDAVKDGSEYGVVVSNKHEKNVLSVKSLNK